MELERVHQIEQAIRVNREEILRPGISILFIVGIILHVGSRGEVSPMLVAAGMVEQIHLHHLGRDMTDVERFPEDFQLASLEEKGDMLQQLNEHSVDVDLSKMERRGQPFRSQSIDIRCGMP